MIQVFCWLIFVALMVVVEQSAAALTESEAISRGVAHPEWQLQMNAQMDIAEGAAGSAGRWVNPQIEYSREALDLPSGNSVERSVWLRQSLNVAGVPALERRAVRQQLSAARARRDFAQRVLITELSLLFHQTLAAEAEAGELAAWNMRLTALVAAAAQKVEAGDGSRAEHKPPCAKTVPRWRRLPKVPTLLARSTWPTL